MFRSLSQTPSVRFGHSLLGAPEPEEGRFVRADLSRFSGAGDHVQHGPPVKRQMHLKVCANGAGLSHRHSQPAFTIRPGYGHFAMPAEMRLAPQICNKRNRLRRACKPAGENLAHTGLARAKARSDFRVAKTPRAHFHCFWQSGDAAIARLGWTDPYAQGRAQAETTDTGIFCLKIEHCSHFLNQNKKAWVFDLTAPVSRLQTQVPSPRSCTAHLNRKRIFLQNWNLGIEFVQTKINPCLGEKTFPIRRGHESYHSEGSRSG